MKKQVNPLKKHDSNQLPWHPFGPVFVNTSLPQHIHQQLPNPPMGAVYTPIPTDFNIMKHTECDLHLEITFLSSLSIQ
jgi:hypothetical protein